MEERITFEVSKDDLLKQLIKVSKAVRDKSSLPIYTYILFEVTGDSLTLSGTDTKIQIESAIQVTSASGSMGFCVDKTIIDILKTLPEQPLTIEVNKDKKDPNFVKVNVSITHSSGNIVLNGDNDVEFSKMKKIKGKTFEIPASSLKRGLSKTKKFACNDNDKPIVTSVYFDIKDSCVAFAATDNKIVSRFIDYSIKGIEADSFILDLNSVGILSSILDSFNSETVKISTSANNVSFDIEGLKLTSRLVEGTYLNYDRVFQDNLPINMKSDSKYLTNVINRLLNASDKISSLIRMETGLMQTHLSARDMMMSKSANESVDCECDGEIIIGIKGTQVIDMLSVIDGNAIMSFSEPARPIQIKPELQDEDTELTLLVMPMKLD